MRKTKRLFSGILTVALIVGLLADIPVKAQETLGYDSSNQDHSNQDAAAKSDDDKADANKDASDVEGVIDAIPIPGTGKTEGTEDENPATDDKGSAGKPTAGDSEQDNPETGDAGPADNPETSDSEPDNPTAGDSETGNPETGDAGSADNPETSDSETGNPATDDAETKNQITDGSDAENSNSEGEEAASDPLDFDNPDQKESDAVSALLPSDWEECQYVIFPQNKKIEFEIPENMAVMPLEHIAPSTVYAVNTAKLKEIEFKAVVGYGYRLRIPEETGTFIKEKQERGLHNSKWHYTYSLDVSELSTTCDEPFPIKLDCAIDEVPIKVSGEADIEGVNEDGMAQIGSLVSIGVLTPGYNLAMITEDEKGNTVYTAMELDYANRYEFIVEKEAAFVVADPETADYYILNSAGRKAKLTGEAGLKLKSLASSAQGYQEIVLNFTAVQNGSDGTETESVYYEVKVTAKPKSGETVPAGSPEASQYYYIKKVENTNIQSKAIKVNNGDLSATTACTYEFAVRLVHISNALTLPGEDTPAAAPMETALSGNTIVKSFSTKNLYYENKLSFKKKTTRIYTGQSDVLTGMVKYSKNASYLHNLTAFAYNSDGGVCKDIACTFKNDNDELYVSASKYTVPGKYTVVIYAGIADAGGNVNIGADDNVNTQNSPQEGDMYQANASFTLTVDAGINSINTSMIVKQVAAGSKNVTFSAVPVGWSGYYTKSKNQKFTYEIKSAKKVYYNTAEDSDNPEESNTSYVYETIEPSDKVKSSISVNKSGKVTIKKGYTVDANTGEDYIAIVINAADFEGNTATETAYVKIMNTALVPTEIYLTDDSGNRLGTTLTAEKAHYAKVIVLDQFGKNMLDYVNLTPVDNAKGTAKAYVTKWSGSDYATLYVRKTGNINIKAVSTDGGKKSKTLKLKVESPQASSRAVMYGGSNFLTYNGAVINDHDLGNTTSGRVTYNAPRGAVLRFRQGFKINGKDYYTYSRGWWNWGYKVTGGKLKFDNNYWLFTPTAKTARLVFWLKSNPRVTWKMDFVNNSWQKSYSAPKITLRSGKVYSARYSNQAEISSYNEDGFEYIDVPPQSLNYSYDSVDCDSISVISPSYKSPYVWIGSDDHDKQNKTFTLRISASGIKPGSYKYYIAFYKNGSLLCKTSTITIKVNKASKIKIAPKYTLNTSQADSITLKCTPDGFLPDFDTKLLNSNIGGKANDFNKYFELVTATDSMGVSRASIKFKDSVTPQQKEELKGKTLTGYVKYTYYLGYNKIEHDTSKVAVKVK